MAEIKLFKGGEFLITDALPEEIFTPEDLARNINSSVNRWRNSLWERLSPGAKNWKS